jgi:hypothetical protein
MGFARLRLAARFGTFGAFACLRLRDCPRRRGLPRSQSGLGFSPMRSGLCAAATLESRGVARSRVALRGSSIRTSPESDFGSSTASMGPAYGHLHATSSGALVLRRFGLEAPGPGKASRLNLHPPARSCSSSLGTSIRRRARDLGSPRRPTSEHDCNVHPSRERNQAKITARRGCSERARQCARNVRRVRRTALLRPARAAIR